MVRPGSIVHMDCIQVGQDIVVIHYIKGIGSKVHFFNFYCAKLVNTLTIVTFFKNKV